MPLRRAEERRLRHCAATFHVYLMPAWMRDELAFCLASPPGCHLPAAGDLCAFATFYRHDIATAALPKLHATTPGRMPSRVAAEAIIADFAAAARRSPLCRTHARMRRYMMLRPRRPWLAFTGLLGAEISTSLRASRRFATTISARRLSSANANACQTADCRAKRRAPDESSILATRRLLVSSMLP